MKPIRLTFKFFTMKRYLLFFICFTMTFFQPVRAQFNGRRHFNTTRPMVHDPVLAREDSTYYVFSTGWGISCISSTDLQTWHVQSPVFAKPPQWAVKLIKGYNGYTWAPDVVYRDGKYHIFYSCSTFGKNTSAIGHAVRTTLDVSDTLHRWIDKGMVIKSVSGKDDWNAIDPAVAFDDDGHPWMSFGSFWDGIQLVPLKDNLNGLKRHAKPKTIARRVIPNRAGLDDAIEAPFIFRHANYYYLFVSFDYCCRGNKSNYKVAVGRSANIEGPYVDKENRAMTEGGGSLLFSGNAEFIAGGHCAAYHFDGKDYFICHGYSIPDEGMSELILCPLTWDANGWPVLEMSDAKPRMAQN
jgi:arabinan endo-1,5-alpha-L-arabinosidase